ncbi:MAG: MFS transporter [unclassified Hahellaceae]|nr:MFS transporter [Hahellaceae bacterium]|tara:strand:- start:21735 stop:23642 length:1908 start_codon:yes stop_codon:yes gene_type:complete
MAHHSPLALMRSRKFLPFFLTQALGAFNDNVFKNALLLLLTFSAGSSLGMDINVLVNLAAGLFILPFFLISPMAGQIADKYEKSAIIRWVKLGEVIIMTLAAVALIYDAYAALLLLLLAMGTQSAFFGPVKYAIMPQHLNDRDLVGGNALVEMGTFLAILAGTILAGVLSPLSEASTWIAITVVLLAVAGYVASRGIPEAAASNPGLKIDWNPFTQLAEIWRQTRGNQAVFQSILAISWFWFLGASYLTQFPNFTKDVLSAGAGVVTLLLAVFSVGIAIGSMLCERLSHGRVELGIVPIGALGLTVFGADLYFASVALQLPLAQAAGPELLHTISSLWGVEGSGRLLVDLGFIGLSGGLFIVPLYALIQQRSAAERRAQVIAANNVLNALFMVVSAVFAIVCLSVLALSIPTYFLVLALINLLVSIYVFRQVPEFAFRFIIWILGHTIYRVRTVGLDNLPEDGPALLVCNHVSYADAVIIGGAIYRPVRFVMDRTIAGMPGMRWFFRMAKTIPICSERADAAVYQAAFAEIQACLEAGEVVCIFPEGRLTTDGEIAQFRKGVERIVATTPVPVVPMALQGLWGSVFSHAGGTALTKLPRRFWSKITLVLAAPESPEMATAERLQARVEALRGDLK